MQSMLLAGALIRSRGDRVRPDPQELELLYSEPRRGLREITRVAVAFAAAVACAALLA